MMIKKRYISLIVLIISCLGINAQKNFIQIGDASFYDDKFVGQYTASGEKYDHNKLTAAHLTLPFGSKIKVTNFENDQSVIVTINDRGPFVQGRIIDLSKSAAEKIGMLDKGLVKVRVEVVGNSQFKKTVAEKPKPVEIKNNTIKSSNPEPGQHSNNEIYRVEATKIPANGFGVQVGSFNESYNFLATLDNIKRNTNEPVFVNVLKSNDVVSYKVIVGNVNKRNQAEELKNALSKNYQGCFIVSFK